MKEDIKKTYDEHGHPELGKVSKAHIFNEMLENKLKELKIKVKSRPVEIGYEVRCQTPIAYDLVYCSELGMGVYKLFSEGKTGCMVYISQDGFVSPLYLKDLQDPATGKIPPRLVNIDSDKIQHGNRQPDELHHAGRLRGCQGVRGRPRSLRFQEDSQLVARCRTRKKTLRQPIRSTAAFFSILIPNRP